MLRCDSPNIKDVERQELDDVETASIFNFGSMQTTPEGCEKILLPEFERELLNFLLKEYEPIIRGKVFYCSINNECKKYFSLDGILKVENIPDLYAGHLRQTHV